MGAVTEERRRVGVSAGRPAGAPVGQPEFPRTWSSPGCGGARLLYRHARCPGRQRRAASHRPRPGRWHHRPAVGGRRLHAHVRRPAALGRRVVRPHWGTSGARDWTADVRCRFGGLRPRARDAHPDRSATVTLPLAALRNRSSSSILIRRLLDALDAEYRSKYGRYGAHYVDPMVSPDARAARRQLLPRA